MTTPAWKRTCVGVAVFAVAAATGCNQRSSNSIANEQNAAKSGSNPSAQDWQGRLNPQMKAVLDELASLGGKPIERLTPEEARQQPTPADAVKSLLRKQGKSDAPEPVGKTQDVQVPSAQGAIPARVYWPKAGKAPYPVVVYFHGGGWVIATIDTYDSSARALANKAGAIVVSVEYRKAPEHKFPAAAQDAYAAYKWALANAGKWKGNAAKVAVAGESAGGNLATVVSMMARENHDKMPVYEVLVYPVAQCGQYDDESYRQNAMAKPLNKAMMMWFCEKYMNGPSDANDPHLSPLRAADLKGMPPTTVIGAEIDPLRSEGKQYADKLKSAGVNVDYKLYDGVTHEFFGMAAAVDAAKDANELAAKDLRTAFSK